MIDSRRRLPRNQNKFGGNVKDSNLRYWLNSMSKVTPGSEG